MFIIYDYDFGRNCLKKCAVITHFNLINKFNFQTIETVYQNSNKIKHIFHFDLEKFVFQSAGIYFFCTFRHCHFIQPDKTTEAINSSMRKKELENIYKRKINDSYTYMQLFWTRKNNKQKRSLTKIIKLNKKMHGRSSSVSSFSPNDCIVILSKSFSFIFFIFLYSFYFEYWRNTTAKTAWTKQNQ